MLSICMIVVKFNNFDFQYISIAISKPNEPLKVVSCKENKSH
jgi:hypothetical protein